MNVVERYIKCEKEADKLFNYLARSFTLGEAALIIELLTREVDKDAMESAKLLVDAIRSPDRTPNPNLAES